MKNSHIFSSVAAAILLTAGATQATSDMQANLEKCVVTKNGQNIIKEHKGDCKTATATGAGMNMAGDPDAWVFVPKGECEKVNSGDFSGISSDIRDKIQD